jgi:CHAT domain-containing protein
MAGQLNCDLAVLGSCQSGSGPISEGESLSGLAYGFSYLGVPSLIYSLWAVDENATNQLFSQFYASLKKGEDKSAALRGAQIQYLRQANEETASPFFWAGFVLTGQNQAYTFQQQNPTNLWWWFAGSIVLIVLISTQKTKIWAALNPSLRI